MVVLENFKIEKESMNFCIYELVERDEYEKGEFGKIKKTGGKVKKWVDIESYHGKFVDSLKRVVDFAIERNFNDLKNIKELIEKINFIKSQIDNFCKG